MTFGVQYDIKISVFADASTAPVYREGYEPIEIDNVVIVENGTEQHRATIDLVLIDRKGNKYVMMAPLRLWDSIAQFRKAVNERS